MFVYYGANHTAANKICVVLLYKHNFRQNYIQYRVHVIGHYTHSFAGWQEVYHLLSVGMHGL